MELPRARTFRGPESRARVFDTGMSRWNTVEVRCLGLKFYREGHASLLSEFRHELSKSFRSSGAHCAENALKVHSSQLDLLSNRRHNEYAVHCGPLPCSADWVVD